MSAATSPSPASARGAGAGPESPHAFCAGLEGGALLVGDVRSPALTKRGKMAR